jgi:hypothetical protein
MDSSDIAKKRKHMTIFCDIANKAVVQNGTCASVRTGCSPYTATCQTTFTSYNIKMSFEKGQKAVNKCDPQAGDF